MCVDRVAEKINFALVRHAKEHMSRLANSKMLKFWVFALDFEGEDLF